MIQIRSRFFWLYFVIIGFWQQICNFSICDACKLDIESSGECIKLEVYYDVSNDNFHLNTKNILEVKINFSFFFLVFFIHVFHHETVFSFVFLPDFLTRWRYWNNRSYENFFKQWSLICTFIHYIWRFVEKDIAKFVSEADNDRKNLDLIWIKW